MYLQYLENIFTTAIYGHRTGSAISSRGRSIIRSTINWVFTASTMETLHGGIVCSAHFETPMTLSHSAVFQTDTNGTWFGCFSSETAINPMRHVFNGYSMSRASVFLLVIGLLQMTGDLLRVPQLKGLAAATGASPAPKVFSSVQGLETFSSDFYVAWKDRN